MILRCKYKYVGIYLWKRLCLFRLIYLYICRQPHLLLLYIVAENRSGFKYFHAASNWTAAAEVTCSWTIRSNLVLTDLIIDRKIVRKVVSILNIEFWILIENSNTLVLTCIEFACEEHHFHFYTWMFIDSVQKFGYNDHRLATSSFRCKFSLFGQTHE